MLMLKTIRKQQGLSVAKLSELSGVHRRTIEDAESHGNCRLDTAYKLAKAMGVPLGDLWEEDPEE